MAAVAEKTIGADDSFIGRQPEELAEAEYQSDVRKLVDLLSNLNPAAKEFFPSNYAAAESVGCQKPDGRLSADAPLFEASSGDGSPNSQPNYRRWNVYNQGRKKKNDRARGDEREDSIRRTVYVSDLDRHVTEEKLAEIFANYGQVVDCRICSDPHSALRFAFIEFLDQAGARAALNLDGTMLGYFPVKVLPSKTAILPVNRKFLPRSDDEKEMVVRTVYCTNIDKRSTQTDVKLLFEQLCGEVSRLRLLGDTRHTTHIAFVEFVQAESAILALNCSGIILGSLPIRVSPSKTPVRVRVPRPSSSYIKLNDNSSLQFLESHTFPN
ncbi:polyadenylate-binding protein-interacting protein 8-like [Zingiber officinale]|uniref:polyadenylate-binding protein-interacting protein 8-like n=1 Tax=Zingiber officinale TaxID=94328 RepID=UPI001C4D00D9|nr:polyadenylate-binding protein-interacting protein 8-like [Zingiber officinale]